MIITMGRGEEERVATVYFDGKTVVLTPEPGITSGDLQIVNNIYYGDRTYTPADGRKYLVTLIKYARAVNYMQLMPEETDKAWFPNLLESIKSKK